MRDVRLINKDGEYYIEDFDLRVTAAYKDPITTIQEWEYFEKLNNIGTRFLNHVTPLEEIESIVNKLKSKI